MKKYFLGLLMIFAFAFSLCSCVIHVNDNDPDDEYKRVKLYQGYFYNESDWTITSWGARDVETNKIYQSDSSDVNYISSGYYNGPIYVPENSKISMQMMFKRDKNTYETPDSYVVRGKFEFHFYYDDDYDWTRRQAGQTAGEPRPYLKDADGNIIFLEKVEGENTIKAF